MMQTVTVRSMQHPIDGPSVIEDVPFKRQRLSTLINRYAMSHDVSVGVNGQLVPKSEWRTKRVKPADVVDMTPAVGGFWFSLQLLWALGPKFWLTAAATTTFAVAAPAGAAYLGGKLLSGGMEEPPDYGAPSPTAGFYPHSVSQEGVPQPRCFGRNMLFGNIIGNWTEVTDGSNGLSETLYLLIDHGQGPYEGKVSGETYMNGRPVSNFSNVTEYERVGTFGQSAIFDQHKLEFRPEGMDMNQNQAVTFTTPDDFFDDIEFTLEWPGGHYYYSSRGRLATMATRYKVEISVKDAGSWTTILDNTLWNSDLRTLYRGYKVSELGFSVSRGTRYDLKFTKLTADSQTRLQTDMRVRSVREVIDVAFTRPGRVLHGLKIVDSKQLGGGRADIKSVWECMLCNTYDGSDWTIQYTRNRAWIVMHILTQPIISGAGTSGDPWTIESYEGMSAANIDTAWFYEWAQWCEEQVTDGDGGTEDRMPCDYIADTDSTVWAIVQAIANIGRAHLFWKGTTLTGWVDTPTSTVAALVCNKNIVPHTWSNAWAGDDELVGRITVFFRDSGRDYQRRPLPFNNENAGNYLRRVSLEGVGVTSTSLATRVGNFALGRNQRIRNRNTFEMFKEGVRIDPGDVIRLHAKKPDWGKAYRVKKATANDTVEVDKVPECEAGDALHLQVFNESSADVEVDSYTVESITKTTITITTTWDVEPQRNWLITTGSTKLRRVTDNVWLPNNRFRITCETYDGDIEDTDADTPNLVAPDYTPARPGRNLVLPPVNYDEVVDLITQRLNVVTRPIVTDIPGTGNIEWSGNAAETIYWEAIELAEPMHVLYKGEQYDIDGNESAGRGSTTDMFVFFDPNSSASDGFLTTDDPVVAYYSMTIGRWLMCINKDGVAYPATPMQLVHAGVLMAGTITAELGQIANLAVGTLQIQDQAVTIPQSDYVAAKTDITTSYTRVSDLTITPLGSKIHFQWTCTIFNDDAAGAQRITGIQFRRDSTVLYTDSNAHVMNAKVAASVCLAFEDTPSAGADVLYSVWLVSDGNYIDAYCKSLLALTVKK